MGGVWEGAGIREVQRHKEDTTAQGGARAEELLCWELLCLDSSLEQKPHPTSQSPAGAAHGWQVPLWSVRFSSNKAQFYFLYCELTADANTWEIILALFLPKKTDNWGYRSNYFVSNK